MSARGMPGTPPAPPTSGGGAGGDGCCSSGATLELVGAFTAVCLVLYALVLYLNYLYARWSSVRRTSDAAGGDAARKGAGIDKAALAAMPVLRFKAERDGGVDADVCAVCLCAMQDGDAVRALPGCGHAFHAACVDAWLCKRATCPVCRARPALPPPQRAPKAGAKAAAARQLDLESQV